MLSFSSAVVYCVVEGCGWWLTDWIYLQVYEDAVVAIGLSIDLWVAYLDFYINNSKTEEEIRV